MLLIGAGTPGGRTTGFPQLRLAHFRDALIAGGVEVLTARWDDPRLRERTQGVDAVVSAGPFGPGRAAAAIAGELPFWADIPGDPLAEAQAVALAAARGDAEPGASPEQRRSAALEAAWAVIARADAFSVISAAQRHALLGQLGLAGRLGADRAEQRIAVIPVAWRADLPVRAPATRAPGAPLRLALAGGFNTWFDEQTLQAGLERVFAKTTEVRVVCAGGGLPGHHSAGYSRFEAWAQRTAQVDLHPWVPDEALDDVIGAAHLGICLDRSGVEPELGSRTRLLLFARLGLGVIGTAGTPLAAEAAAEGWLRPIPVGDPEALAQAVLDVHARGSDGQAVGAAQIALARRYSPETCAAPLVAWASNPTRLQPSQPPEAALAQEIGRLRAELAAVYASPTWRALDILRRVLHQSGVSYTHTSYRAI